MDESAYYPESERLAELLARIGASLDDKVHNPPIDPYLTRAQWEHLAHEPVPLTPAPVDELVDELVSLLIPNGGRVSDPGFWAFVTTAPTTFAVAEVTEVPAAIVTRIHTEMVKMLNQPDVKALFLAQGMDTVGNTPAEFAAYIRGETEKWTRVVRMLGIAPQ